MSVSRCSGLAGFSVAVACLLSSLVFGYFSGFAQPWASWLSTLSPRKLGREVRRLWPCCFHCLDAVMCVVVGSPTRHGDSAPAGGHAALLSCVPWSQWRTIDRLMNVRSTVFVSGIVSTLQLLPLVQLIAVFGAACLLSVALAPVHLFRLVTKFLAY